MHYWRSAAFTCEGACFRTPHTHKSLASLAKAALATINTDTHMGLSEDAKVRVCCGVWGGGGRMHGHAFAPRWP